ncbi:MAG TPA: alanine--tRNA ligase-related protein [Streptosporangiaceae bacterium]|jgi:alanyl-tRNA synthetase
MDTTQIIETFTEFFRERGHQLITGSTLIPPPGDPVLFTTSGMHPLTPYLEGRPHPLGRRLVNVQRCLRTTDLDEVGDAWHLTVFEMLGTWSLGDYPGQQSLRWGYELITGGFGVSQGRLHATVFGGGGDLGPDEESARTWAGLGVPVELTREGNWWSNGPSGPCGPDSELFAWTGAGPPEGTPGTDGRWTELWNHVSMRYRRLDDGSLRPLEQANVDTGMGLERLAALLQGTGSVFETDLFLPWLTALGRLWGLSGQPLRLVTDHLRSAVVVLADGARPGNTGRGYVPRRLIRRALTTLWRDDPGRSLADLPAELISATLTHFRQNASPGEVTRVLLAEQRRFTGLLDRGRSVLTRLGIDGPPTPEQLHYLHDTHGLPPDLVTGLLAGPS